MQRYFMTIPEASQPVMHAGAIGQGGEILVLDMGRPVRILDLAMELIHRRGLEPGRDIDIEFTGPRPGEKLFEELAGDDEPIRPTAHDMIRVWELPRASALQMKRMLEVLAESINGTRDQVIMALTQCLPDYRPALGTVDGVRDQATSLRLMVEATRAARAA
jgi:FlaA1/EpsC-like NDP-sugar epimerase